MGDFFFPPKRDTFPPSLTLLAYRDLLSWYSQRLSFSEQSRHCGKSVPTRLRAVPMAYWHAPRRS